MMYWKKAIFGERLSCVASHNEQNAGCRTSGDVGCPSTEVGTNADKIIRDRSWFEVRPTCNVSGEALIGRVFHARATVRTILFGACCADSQRAWIHSQSGRFNYPLSGRSHLRERFAGVP